MKFFSILLINGILGQLGGDEFQVQNYSDDAELEFDVELIVEQPKPSPNDSFERRLDEFDLFESSENSSINPPRLTSQYLRGAKARKQANQAKKNAKNLTTTLKVATTKTTAKAPDTLATDDIDGRGGAQPDKPFVPHSADNEEIIAIQKRMEDVVNQANRWIFNNIAKNSERDSQKAKRLTERFTELPERYMKVIARCRDPKTLGELEEIRASRPIRQEERILLKKERHLAQAAKWGSEGEKTIKKAEIAEKRRLKQEERGGEPKERGEKVKFNEYEEETITFTRGRRETEVERKPKGIGKTTGKKFRPGRVMRRPERYYEFLKLQIEQRKLQRNELKCDVELYPECGQKGKKGVLARKKFRPDSKEAMWTKIIRALRLAALEIRNECHIWDRIDKKTSKLKTKSHKLYIDSRAPDVEKDSKKTILMQQQN